MVKCLVLRHLQFWYYLKEILQNDNSQSLYKFDTLELGTLSIAEIITEVDI